MELPKFNQLLLMYPGYYHYNGTYRDNQVVTLVTGNETYEVEGMDNTASLRLSWAFNRYGGRHALGEDPIYLSRAGRDSIAGTDHQQYIFRNTAFGPFLAAKYGNPSELYKRSPHGTGVSLDQFRDKQGIMRLVSYKHDHPDGHIGLWNCNHFFQSRDWTHEHHMIAVEFWETPGRYSFDLQRIWPNNYVSTHTTTGYRWHFIIIDTKHLSV